MSRSASAARPAARAAPRRASGRRAARAAGPRASLVAVAAIALVATIGYLGFVRDSSLVAVKRVSVTGLGTRDAADMRAALLEAGRSMTTLHVRERDLEAALARYPVVRAVSARPDFPHGLRVHVTERRPVATVSGPSGAAVPVAADGTLLPRARPRTALPLVRAQGSLAGERLAERPARTLLRVLGAAPAPLRERALRARFDGARGVVVSLRRGPEVVLGRSDRLEAKWAAASRVLATAAARGASYVDVRLPDRPAAGGVAPEPSAPETGPEGAAGVPPAGPQVGVETPDAAHP